MRPPLICVALAVCLSAHLRFSNAAPAGAEVAEHQQQETLETLHLGEPGSDYSAPRDKRTIGPLRQLFPGLSQAEAENQLSGAESQVSEVRVQLNQQAPQQESEDGDDLKPAASGDSQADESQDGGAELENETDAAADDENRNKRFLPFNLNGAAAGGAGGGSGGSGGGSGNFLFDIIRLIAGSGTTQERDEAENAPLDGSTSSAGASASASVGGGAEGKDDGYQEGVPGPITRLFVIANRGIANLVQDLILRLAQTSERLVNFKARLITSII